MRDGMSESPFNALPAVVWALALPMIATEALFGLGRIGLVGGAQGIGLRGEAINRTAFVPEVLHRMVAVGEADWSHAYRLLAYPFVHLSLTHGLFVIVFTLALGNMVAAQFRPPALLGLFFGSAIGGALAYTAFAAFWPGRIEPLVGGYPAVYGLVGAFTFLLWTRLAETGGSRARAFTLIGMLLAFQLVFGLIFGAGTAWVAEVSGFVTGFALSFLLVQGGLARALRQIRRR